MYKKYEAIFIVKNLEENKKIEETIKNIDNIINMFQGIILKREKIGIKNLAYEVKGEKKGFFYLLNYKIPEERLNSDRKIKIEINTLEEVIKYIILPMNEE